MNTDIQTSPPDLESHNVSRAEVEFLSNRKILNKAREMIQYQDGKLDHVSAIGQNMKEDGLMINEELGIHNNLLTNLNDDVELASKHMTKVDTRLKKVFNSTNT
mmetsp:Transcript_10428/g.9211  ORF Transcript_10428/g.9211 Transcript_10428/m.9211 type:complete len:104 (+) Transcript_10428:338-649(+)